MTTRSLLQKLHRSRTPSIEPELILNTAPFYVGISEICTKRLVDGELRDDDLTTGSDYSPITSLRARGLTLTNCNLSGASALNSYLYRVTLVGCNLRGTLLSRSTIEHIRFVDCDLAGASFAHAQMHEVSFENCDLSGTDFYGAKITALTLPPGVTSALLEGAYVDAHSYLPLGYQRDPPAPAIDLSESSSSHWVKEGKLTIQRVSHDLSYLTSPHASSSSIEFLVREHPRVPTATLLALAEALATP